MRPAGDNRDADLRCWGIDPAQMPGFFPASESEMDADDFGVWPENFAAALFFMTVQTQFHWTMNGATGLDYARVEAAANLQCLPRRGRPDLFERLRGIEAGALEAMNARAAQ